MIKKLLYCGLMLLTINTFALQINWSDPKETYPAQYYPFVINSLSAPTLVVDGEKIIFFCYDDLKVKYRICKFDKNNNLNVLNEVPMPLKDIREVISYFKGPLEEIMYPQFAEIPNTNKYVELIYNVPGNSSSFEPDIIIDKCIYRIASVNDANNISWSSIKELPKNLLKNTKIQYTYTTCTENGYFVLIGKKYNRDDTLDDVSTYIAYGKINMEENTVDWITDNFVEIDFDLHNITGVYSLKDGYLILKGGGYFYKIGNISNDKLTWGSTIEKKYLYRDEHPTYIKHLDKLFTTSGSSLTIYDIDYNNYNLILNTDIEINWDANWWDKYFQGNSANSVYFSKTQNVAVLGAKYYDKYQPYHTIGTFSDNLPSDAPLKGKGL